MALTDNQLDTLIQDRQEKKKKGGFRPGSGRKKRLEEEEVIQRLQPMADLAFRVLERKIGEGDPKALQIFMNYYIGLPTQKIESKIEGNLNQVSVEVVKPEAVQLEKVA